MKIAVFGTQKVRVSVGISRKSHPEFNLKYDIESLNGANSENGDFKFTFLDALLDKTTAPLAAEHDAVCIFVNDICDETVLQKLSALGVVRLCLL